MYQYVYFSLLLFSIMTPQLRNRSAKRYCVRCHAQCLHLHDYLTCDGCSRFFHYKCLIRSKKYTGKKLKEITQFFCSKKCETTVFPFNLVRDKEFVKMNANEIREPCTKCGGNVIDLISFNVTNVISGRIEYAQR